jgi:tRNA1Val (adenine37-N6)-methyltransferase
MNVFRFKQFEVRNELSAMKVNTDGVLLGALAPVRGPSRRVLDIGTGTGTIALMLAQRLESAGGEQDTDIIGIDIDADAAAEAELNFKASRWAERLTALNISLEEFGERERQSLAGAYSRKFDLIVSNPPYYDSSLTNPDERKTLARHTGNSLSYREVLDFAAESLSECGELALVLPAEDEQALLRYGRSCGLYASGIVRIRTVERKPFRRIVVTFARTRQETVGRTLTIMEKGKYTLEYISLVKDFYLFA